MNFQNVRVVQYNILCQKLADPNYHKCNPEHLLESTRLEMIKNRLSTYMDDGCILCLQEVPQSWCGRFYDFFTSKNYGFIYSNYGTFFNDYMGVALAYPLDFYKASNTEIFRVGSTIRTPKKVFPLFFNRMWESVNYYLGKCQIKVCKNIYDKIQKNKFNPWDYSRNRPNTCIITTLNHLKLSKDFVVASYHMPCTHWQPRVTTISLVHLFKRLAQYANNLPVVLGTDANFTPKSYQYKLATEGCFELDHPDHPNLPDGSTEWIKTFKPMNSVHKFINGYEPEFTIKSSTTDTCGIFSDTLDYIFFTGDVKPIFVMDIPEYDKDTILPNDKEPSDHIELAAEFVLL